MTFPTWDKSSLIWINSHHNVFLDAILAPVAWAGEVAVVWWAVCLVLLIVGRPGWRMTALILFLTIVITDRVLNASLQHFIFRTRPYMAIEGLRYVGKEWTSSSFPSGHAHSVWIAAIVLGDRFRRLRLPLVIFALFTCYSRPYFGMHYPLDTIAGAALGIAAGFTAVLIRHRLRRRKLRNWNSPSPQPSPVKGEGAGLSSTTPVKGEGAGLSPATPVKGEGAGLSSAMKGELHED